MPSGREVPGGPSGWELEKLPKDCRPWGPSLELEIFFEIAPQKSVFFSLSDECSRQSHQLLVFVWWVLFLNTKSLASNSSLKETLLDLRAPKFDMREVRQKRCQRQVGLVAAFGFPRWRFLR